MSHRKGVGGGGGHSKKGKGATSVSMAGVSKSTVSRSDMISRVNDTPVREKGISYSTIQQDVTVTTDSANGAEMRLGVADDIKANYLNDNSMQSLKEDVAYPVLPLIRESCPPKPLDQTAPLLKYEDFFRSEHTSMVDQTFLQRNFK